jgi:hypothetical protein
MSEINYNGWEKPEFFWSTVLSYIHSTSKEEFEGLGDIEVIIVPVVGGEVTITKEMLLREVKLEVQQYKDAGEK